MTMMISMTKRMMTKKTGSWADFFWQQRRDVADVAECLWA